MMVCCLEKKISEWHMTCIAAEICTDEKEKIMEKELLDAMEGKSREERKEIFEAHKSELLDAGLDAVNGGEKNFDIGDPAVPENPYSERPYKGNWISSEGYVCKGNGYCD